MVVREGNLEAPNWHPVDWNHPLFYNQAACEAELKRIFGICHGCRRGVSLCQSFSTLSDLIDATPEGEVHGVDRRSYQSVVDQRHVCDLRCLTKCSNVPPHPWNLDFPHTMPALPTPWPIESAAAACPSSNSVTSKVRRSTRKRTSRCSRSMRAKVVRSLAAIPSCTLMLKQELPMLPPDDADVALVQKIMFDPFEYWTTRNLDGLLKLDFRAALGKVSYHTLCHGRVQKIGKKTEEVFKLIGQAVPCSSAWTSAVWSTSEPMADDGVR